MGQAGTGPEGVRLRGLVVVLCRAGLCISEALARIESDLDPSRGAILVRHGKGGKRREVGMDHWGWEQLQPWPDLRITMPIGALFCVIHGRICGPQSRPSAGLPPEPALPRRRRRSTLACLVTSILK